MSLDVVNNLCPDCRGRLLAQASVTHGRHQSRWWKCSSPQCGSAWLLPLGLGRDELAETQENRWLWLGLGESEQQLELDT